MLIKPLEQRQGAQSVCEFDFLARSDFILVAGAPRHTNILLAWQLCRGFSVSNVL
jgi:hypothetical protein